MKKKMFLATVVTSVTLAVAVMFLIDFSTGVELRTTNAVIFAQKVAETKAREFPSVESVDVFRHLWSNDIIICLAKRPGRYAIPAVAYYTPPSEEIRSWVEGEVEEGGVRQNRDRPSSVTADVNVGYKD